MPIKKLKLEKIVVTAGTDVRSEISEATVTEYGEAAHKKAKLPPLVVFDTKDDGLLLADGFHRYFGFERQGIKEWDCDIREGTRADAIKFALGCNTTHGLRRSNDDKRHSVMIALKEFSKLSNRMVAQLCLVDDHTVAEVREEMEEKTERQKLLEEEQAGAEIRTSNDEITEETQDSPPPRRQGADGKSYKVPPRKSIPTEPKKPDTMDATGIQVPEEIVPYWDSTFAESQRLLNLTSEARTRLKRAQDINEPAFREVDLTDAIAKLDQVYADLKRMKPYAVCPDCNGIPSGGANGFQKKGVLGGCGTCKGRGFVSEFYWKTFVPAEKKQVTGRA